MYIQQICPLSIFFLTSKPSTTLTILFVAVTHTHTSAKISNTFPCCVVVTNQLCSVNLLYPRLTGVAFMYKLRPLDDNPIEHTGLQNARPCSNIKRRLYFCRKPPVSLSRVALLFSLRLSEG